MNLGSFILTGVVGGIMLSALILFYWNITGVPETSTMITAEVFIVNFFAAIFSWLIKMLIRREK